MSTFKGVVTEFPNIRIDFFRRQDGLPPPLACFLSHVHSDHLLGLESLKAPFVYCSPATKEILLRLEKYPSRMNFLKGVLETRKQTYKHLKLLLKTIPLETPTVIELSPGNEIRVTLFDANHCVGAVMFLVEGNGRSILYTGDIRSEDWWIRSLAQNPVLLPYAAGIKKLDNIYLDTTFATKNKLYRNFPSKADGLAELLRKVSLYPKDTIFYLHSWTFGYENVWIAMSSFLESQVHLDEYRWSLYQSLDEPKGGVECPEAVQFNGFKLGHHTKEGCLTHHPSSRIHSCERGSGCPIMGSDANIVTILPVVTRREDGIDVHEIGTGGGQGDLDQVQELDVRDENAVRNLLELCAERLDDPQTLDKIRIMLESCSKSRRARMRLESHFNDISLGDMETEKKLTTVVDELAILVEKSLPTTGENSNTTDPSVVDNLPDIITFPYSRHSSYFELRALVAAFKPKEVFPCTVDEPNWKPAMSMDSLFGDLCSGNHFQHDQEMLGIYYARLEESSSQAEQETQNEETQNTHHTASSQPESQGSEMPFHTAPAAESQASVVSLPAYDEQTTQYHSMPLDHSVVDGDTTPKARHQNATQAFQNVSSSFSVQETDVVPPNAAVISPPPIKRRMNKTEASEQAPRVTRRARLGRTTSQQAYDAAAAGTWAEFGGLVCTKAAESQELGLSTSSQTEEEL